MNGKSSFRYRQNIRGFTLIEIAVVVLIVGVLTAPLAGLYTQYLQQKVLDDTKKNVDSAVNVIVDFQLNNGRYPCPADPALPPTDPNYGLERRDTATGLCIVGGSCATGVCRATNGYDTDNAGGPDNVLIGAIPFRSLSEKSVNHRVSFRTATDGFHNKLGYAVTEVLTVSSTFNTQRGALIVNQQDGTTAIIQSTTPGAPSRGAHFAIFSHGKDGNGAFNTEGKITAPCGTMIQAADNENCNGDAILMQGVSNIFGPGPNHYDDYVKYKTILGSSLWVPAYSHSDPTDPTSPLVPDESQIQNTNTGNVGINTSTPQQRLDITGTLTSTNRIQAGQICDQSGANCFSAETLATPLPVSAGDPVPPINCTSGLPMDGISLSNELCKTITFPALPLPAGTHTCPAGQHVSGLSTDGSVVCQ